MPGAAVSAPTPHSEGGECAMATIRDKLVALTTKCRGPVVRIVTGLSFGYKIFNYGNNQPLDRKSAVEV